MSLLLLSAACGSGNVVNSAQNNAVPAPQQSTLPTLPATPPVLPAPDPNIPSIQVLTAARGVGGDGSVEFDVNPSTAVTDFQTTLTVPAAPAALGTLFLWPGLQPGGANFEPIDNGVLQPVLTWGPSCAPGVQPADYSTWWVSGQYVNTYGKDPGYTGCLGGNVLSVAPADALQLDFSLQGNTWTQTIVNVRTQKSVSYAIDMRGQAQNRLLFVIEAYGSAPLGDVIFTNTTFSVAQADDSACVVAHRGKRDAVLGIKRSPNGRVCSVDKVVLRAAGVPATDPALAGP